MNDSFLAVIVLGIYATAFGIFSIQGNNGDNTLIVVGLLIILVIWYLKIVIRGMMKKK